MEFASHDGLIDQLPHQPFSGEMLGWVAAGLGVDVAAAREVLAKSRFGLELTDPSTEGNDARRGNFTVEIKATEGSRGVALRGLKPLADHLLVLMINAGGQEAVI